MIAVHHFLGAATFVAGFQGNGYPMFIGSADGYDIFSPLPHITDIDIGGDVNACQVTQMNGAVCIRQGRGYQVSLVGFSCHGALFRESTKIVIKNGADFSGFHT
jgi:hypothetical protein